MEKMKSIQQENLKMNFPNELINIVMSYMSSPTAELIKNFSKDVEERWREELNEELDLDNDFYFAVFANTGTTMVRRFCLCDAGIFREGAVNV